MNLYFFSGLGADKRVFQRLDLPKDWHIIHVDWIPNQEHESLAGYCRRLSASIDTTQPFSFVGLSFGGIVAIEIATFLQPARIIIISSVSTRQELPSGVLGDLLLKKLKLFRFIPDRAFKKTNAITYWLFGTKTADEKALLDQIIKDTPPAFAKWALNNIVNWDNETRPSSILHIHGSADRIFPIKKIKADIIIPGGGHFMVYTHAGQISGILREELGNGRRER